MVAGGSTPSGRFGSAVSDLLDPGSDELQVGVALVRGAGLVDRNRHPPVVVAAKDHGFERSRRLADNRVMLPDVLPFHRPAHRHFGGVQTSPRTLKAMMPDPCALAGEITVAAFAGHDMTRAPETNAATTPRLGAPTHAV